MRIEELIEYYGSWSKASRVLDFGITTGMRWKRMTYIPIQTQIRIEMITDGLFKPSLEDCRPQFDKYRKD